MKPLILDYEEAREEIDLPIPYSYDYLQSMNVITINGSQKPFIDLKTDDVSLLTKTKVRSERDDDNFLFELGTKTEVKKERDDPHNMFVELTTKTFTVRESDDR